MMLLNRRTFFTILTRGMVLVINLLLVVFTARVWGSEGRGLIALVMTSVSLVTILNNIFSGATVAYHTPQHSPWQLLAVAWGGSLLTSLLGTISIFLFTGAGRFEWIFLLAYTTSLASAVTYYWLGRNRIGRYNLLTLLPPLLIALFLLAAYYVMAIRDLPVYFYIWMTAYLLTAGAGVWAMPSKDAHHPVLPLAQLAKKMVAYGYKSELSYFLQFLNYRVAYYFISAWSGLSELGRFSVAVAVSEAVWIIGRSISSVLYAEVLNHGEAEEKIRLTRRALRQGFLLTVPALVLLAIIPDTLYVRVFGEGFSGIHELILYLLPGILFLALANILGHYFSATGQMNILIVKSALGLATTTLLLLLFLKGSGLVAACLALDTAYLMILLYLAGQFIREMREKRKRESL